MHQCSKKLATSKEHCCFDHSDFPAHSMFTSDVSSGTQVQPQVILDPDYLPDYLSVSYDYGIIQLILFERIGLIQLVYKMWMPLVRYSLVWSH